ncbi:MAG: ATP-dependent RNA helicase SUPV3L1/SUV3 [Hydrogenophaga sp.]|jgi:ATP-dependent RNA helicase SUPV3L1/SUV3
MSLFSLRKSSQPAEPAVNPSDTSKSAASSHPLDSLTGGAFSAPTSGERAARLREWLATEPTPEQMAEVYKDISQRDRGAAKPLKEKLDEQKRQKTQEQIAVDWAQKAQTLLDQSRMNLADAMAWQRDAARAGAPLSREPLATLRHALAERIKAIEDLQHRVQVEREAAVLLAQRIEVLSTKSWHEAQRSVEGLRADVATWQQQAQSLQDDVQWLCVEAKFPPMLDGSRQQLQLVWEAFDAALAQAVAASVDAKAPLPAVPVWADELRQARGEPAMAAAEKHAQHSQAQQERRAQVATELDRLLSVLERELAEGHGKATPKAAADVRNLIKSQARLVGPELEARAHAALSQAGELEGWQRWRADQLREELVAKAEALVKTHTTVPEGQRPGGRKLQETLRGLRDQWKTTDQGGQPNHALWKRFDEACNEAHKGVEAWLAQVRQQADQHKAQRLGLIEELNAWTLAHAEQSDWKAQVRDLYAFSERWRQAGHLGEKAFAEMQPLWKAAMLAAHGPLDAAQATSLATRRALIEEAQALGAAPQLRIDAVKALQARWQAEAQAVPMDRKQEQKLWDAFRNPIDAAFARKSSERERSATALNAHDQRVLDASRALEAASAGGDAQQIRAAMSALEAALAGQAEERAAAAAPAPTAAPAAAPAPAVDAVPSAETAADGEASADAEPTAEETPSPTPAKPAAPAKKLVAVRGDDRPGMKKTEPASRDGRRGDRPDPRRSGGPGAGGAPGGWRDDRGMREEREPRGPRLGDAAFRAQRQAIEAAQHSLRKLAEQAHGEVLTELMSAWEQRDGQQLPTTQALGGRISPAARSAWMGALAKPAAAVPADALLRLEMAAEVPSPADALSARRMLQLQLLTRRNDPGPAQTWGEDVARVLAGAFDATQARRLQQVLKQLLKR